MLPFFKCQIYILYDTTKTVIKGKKGYNYNKAAKVCKLFKDVNVNYLNKSKTMLSVLVCALNFNIAQRLSHELNFIYPVVPTIVATVNAFVSGLARWQALLLQWWLHLVRSFGPQQR